jgi:hypothetical protein
MAFQRKTPKRGRTWSANIGLCSSRSPFLRLWGIYNIYRDQLKVLPIENRLFSEGNHLSVSLLKNEEILI